MAYNDYPALYAFGFLAIIGFAIYIISRLLSHIEEVAKYKANDIYASQRTKLENEVTNYKRQT